MIKKTTPKLKQIGCQVDRELLAKIDTFAASNYQGQRAMALRVLLARGLKSVGSGQ